MGYQSVTVNSGAAAGSNGSATNNGTSTHIVNGEICSVGVTYGDSPPASTDVTIATTGDHGPALTILTITNANSDGWFNVRHKLDDESAADISYDGTEEVYGKVAVSDTIKVTIAGANANDTAEVVILYYC